jgi:phosphohistidine phosphatase
MSYEFLIVRHGEAVDIGGEINSDAERTLSKKGEEEARAVGRFLEKWDLAPSVILSSPLVRARQTSKAIRKSFEDGSRVPEIIESSELEPGASPPQFLKAFHRVKEEGRRVLFVGHQPDLGRFVSFLISGGSMELQFAVKTGSLAWVEIEEIPLKSPGRLLALLPPRILDRI